VQTVNVECVVTVFETVQNMTVDGITALFEPSVSIKVVEVAKKYEEPEVRAFVADRSQERRASR
jgi:hypothetical protein